MIKGNTKCTLFIFIFILFYFIFFWIVIIETRIHGIPNSYSDSVPGFLSIMPPLADSESCSFQIPLSVGSNWLYSLQNINRASKFNNIIPLWPYRNHCLFGSDTLSEMAARLLWDISLAHTVDPRTTHVIGLFRRDWFLRYYLIFQTQKAQNVYCHMVMLPIDSFKKTSYRPI